jgi:hypothetical protein
MSRTTAAVRDVDAEHIVLDTRGIDDERVRAPALEARLKRHLDSPGGTSRHVRAHHIVASHGGTQQQAQQTGANRYTHAHLTTTILH